MDNEHWHAIEHKQSIGPWAAAFDIGKGHCPNCRQRLVAVLTRARQFPYVWVDNGPLKQGVDYDLLYKNKTATRHPGGIALWAWHPLWEQTKFRDMALAQAAKYKPHGLLIVPPGSDCADWHRFSEVWKLKEHVMGDAMGPYPSVRAELGINAAVDAHGTYRIMHVWPAVTFPFEDYIPLGNNQEIASAWAAHVRRQISLKIQR